jgi:hypothetical protein
MMFSIRFIVQQNAALLAGAIFLASRGFCADPIPNRATTPASNGLVQAALEKELAGDNSQRAALLQQAAQQSPGDAAVHWQLGEVRVQGKWQTVSQTEEAARLDKRLTEYARRRDTAGAHASDQAALARWCRQNKLEEQQRVHWRLVLQAEPDNAEAIHDLGLRPYHGMMVTAAEFDQFRARLRRVTEAADRWRPRVVAWLRALNEANSLMPDDFRQAVLKISDPCEMTGLERALLVEAGGNNRDKHDYRRMTLAVTLALADNPSPAASQGLVRAAVLSESDRVRSAAANALKPRPLESYAPLLLSGLQLPLKTDVQFSQSWDGAVTTQFSIFQEGELFIYANTYSTLHLRSNMHFSPEFIAHYGKWLQVADDSQSMVNANRARSDAAERKAAIDKDVAKANRVIAERNVRTAAVLHHVTGLDLGDKPQPWWNWWSHDFNEWLDAAPTNKPIYNSNIGYVEYPGFYSCFAPGTKVWMQTGKQAIETVKIGDCVLAQDVESGELAYKPVLATTIRKPRPRIRVSFGGESITATPGHPFWVDGQGWRLAKELAVGDRLHTTSGAVTIDRLEKVPPAALAAGLSYNLVVADFNSYFVGDRGILVHDNMPRAPTAALVPGLVKR